MAVNRSVETRPLLWGFKRGKTDRGDRTVVADFDWDTEF